jgi:hypothetical protein
MYRPNIDHITREDYKHVYDPSDDTYLFADAIVKEAAMLQTLGASLCLEVGYVLFSSISPSQHAKQAVNFTYTN